ncbi:MAG: HD domain-containing protein [Lachnospiraceae bacterium]|nr:HD domain-containing protein [Lachnospiraceae bacterium]MBQ6995757.1 HD domain-containing protein [Lachnospiraceae bacterium]
MIIDRNHVKNTFAEYVSHYNEKDEKVKLKIDHTYRVAELCDTIARSVKLSEKDIDLAWLCGMLHDIGRFEQIKNYGTFIDAESVDHALYGAKILFDDGKIGDYLGQPSDELCDFLRKVISCHSAYRVPKEYDERTRMFANILRDADKIDILKVNVEVPLEEIYNVTTEELMNAEVTKEVMDSFGEGNAILRSLKKTPVDHVVGHISLVYELVYQISVKIVQEQGYLDKLMNFPSYNPRTRKQFEELRGMMQSYIARVRLQLRQPDVLTVHRFWMNKIH